MIYLLFLACVAAAGLIFHNLTLVIVLAFGFVIVSSRRIQSNPASSRRFVGQFIVFAGLLIVIMGGFNYVVNPLGIYPTKFIEPILFSSRNSKMSLYQDYPLTPQTLILGSSRAFTVDPQQVEQLWGYPAFNASVGAGTIQDYLAFLRFAIQTRSAPRLLILCLPPEILFPNDLQIVEPNAYLRDYLNVDHPLQGVSSTFVELTRLLGWEQTQASLRSLQTTRSQPYYWFDANGMGHFNPYPISDQELRDGRENWATTYRLANWDDSTVDLLRQLLELAQANQVRMIGYAPPYRPAAAQFFEVHSDLPALHTKVVTLLHSLESAYNFRFIDFSESDLFTAVDTTFYDDVHLTEAASRLLMQALYDQLG